MTFTIVYQSEKGGAATITITAPTFRAAIQRSAEQLPIGVAAVHIKRQEGPL